MTLNPKLPSRAVITSIWHAFGRLFALSLAGLLTAFLAFAAPGWLSEVEERFGGWGWTLFSDETTEERITLVVIDEESIADIGPWPWNRAILGDLVAAIDASGAQLQIHDIVYPEAREGDDQLLGALLETNGAVIAQVPALDSNLESASIGVMSHAALGLDCGSSGLDLDYANSYIAPAEIFSEVPKGHNAAIIDSDGGIRRSPALVCVGDAVYPSLALAAFLQLSSHSDWSVEIERGAGFFEPEAFISIAGYPGLSIPVDKTGAMRIDFSQAPEVFRAVSASDVLSGNFSRELFEDSWVLLGGTAFGMSDIVPTPFSGAAFGIEIQARMLASVLDMSVPFEPAGAPFIQLLLILAFSVIAYFASGLRGKLAGFSLVAIAALSPLASLGVHFYFLNMFGMWIGWVAAAVFGILVSAAMLSHELAQARFERGRVYQNLTSYLPPIIAKEVAFSLPSSNVDAERRDVTLLSADIRNFAAFGESRPPEEIGAILHYFNTRVNEIIESFGGRVAEFRGDNALAMWEGTSYEHSRNALDAAIKLHGALSEGLFADHSITGLEPLALGIGIDQGPVLVGSIGPSNRRSFTVLGDTVSTVLRLQEMTAELAQPILIGAASARHLSDRNLQSQGSYLLPGLTVPHVLFAPPPSAEILRLDGQGNIDAA